MAKKKNETETFDLQKALEELQCPNMFKAGLGYYIESNKIKISNEKDFEKAINDYKQITMGG